MTETKTCGKCGIPQPLDSFREVTQRRWTFRRKTCKNCEKAYRQSPKGRENSNKSARRYYQRHQEKVVQKAREVRAANPEKARAVDKRCKDKHRERVVVERREQYHEDPERFRKRSRDWLRNHPGSRDAYMKQYRETNREDLLAYGRAYNQQRLEESRRYARQRWAAMPVEKRRAEYHQQYQRNPTKFHEAARRRRARKKGAPVVERINRAAIIARDNSTCYLCHKHLEPRQITLDHLIPLVREGTHTADNLMVACRSCNSKKHTMTAMEYLARKMVLLVSARLNLYAALQNPSRQMEASLSEPEPHFQTSKTT